MNVPLLTKLMHLIEEIMKSEVPVVTTAAVETAESDPKVQAITAASVALLSATQDMKAAINAPPDPNVPVS
jgi:hypothetical protein